MSISSLRGVASQQDEVRLVVDLVRLSRLTVLYADAGLDKSAVLRSAVLPLLQDDASYVRKEIAVLFDTWDNEPLAALIRQLNEVAAASIGNCNWRPPQYDLSLTGVLKSWQQELGISFIIILDRFEQHLSTSGHAPATHEFEQHLASAVNDRSLRTHFLLALNEDDAPSLCRLRESIPALDDARVRLRHSGAPSYSVNGAQSSVKPDGVAEPSSCSAPTLGPEDQSWADRAPLEGHASDAAAHFCGSSSEPQHAKRSESLVECLERMRAEYSAPTTTTVRVAARLSSTEQNHLPDEVKAEEAYANTLLRRIVGAKSAIPLTDPHCHLPTRHATQSVATDPAGSRQAAWGGTRTIACRSLDVVADTEGAAATQEMQREQHYWGGAHERYRLSSPAAHVPSYNRFRLYRRVWLVGALGIFVLSLWIIVRPQEELAPDKPRSAKESVAVSPGPAIKSDTTNLTADGREPSVLRDDRAATAKRDELATSDPLTQQRSGLAPVAAAPQTPDVMSARARAVTRAQASAPKPPVSIPAPAAVYGPPGPILYIRIRSESQRARAEQMIRPLAKRGIRVTGIKLVDAGPSAADVRYFDPAERDGAVKIALALRELGVSAQRLQQVSGSEARMGQRRFELWLSPAAP